MAIRGSRPPGEGRDRNWHSLTLERGDSVVGWVAGPVIGVTAHVSSRTKPCLRAYHGPSAVCPGCTRGAAVGWIGYLPIYRARDEWRCVLRIHEDQIPTCELIGHHEQIEASMPMEESAGVQVRRMLSGVYYTPARASRRAPADISDWLPVLWSLTGEITGALLLRGPLADLTHAAETVPPAPPPAPPPPAPPPPVVAMSDEAVGIHNRLNVKPALSPETYDDAKARLLARTRKAKPSANGDSH